MGFVALIPIEFHSQLNLLKLKQFEKIVKFDNTSNKHGSNCPSYPNCNK